MIGAYLQNLTKAGMTTREQIIERFDVIGTSGEEYTVHKIHTFVQIQTPTSSGRGGGGIRYELASGVPVNPLSYDQFEIVWQDRAKSEQATRSS